MSIRNAYYRLNKAFLGWLTRPNVVVSPEFDASRNPCYVLNQQSLTDLAVLDLVCEKQGAVRPTEHFSTPQLNAEPRYFYLNRAVRRILRRNVRQGYPARMVKILAAALDGVEQNIDLVPVSVFWSRAPDKEKSLLKLLLSERWATTSKLRRLVATVFNRKNITVQIGRPIALTELLEPGLDPSRLSKRLARQLRSSFRKQRTAFLGPDRSHRRTLMKNIIESDAVQKAISIESRKQSISEEKSRRLAQKHVNAIASDMSYVAIRFFDRLLTWFWNRIYDGVNTRGVERVREISETHTLVYVPSHRSHVDYLLLSYVLYYQGLKLPHIASGDNLNMPVVGSLLRHAGAFFMRRSFRNDQLYSAVFKEYFFQILDRGYSVVFFPEGGRSRTGRLLPAKVGMINMVMENQQRGLRQPIAFVPMNFGYEKLIEASSYLDELRGSKKKRESLSDVFKNVRLIRQSFGQVTVSFGEPVLLEPFLKQHHDLSPGKLPHALGDHLLRQINACAVMTPVNLISLVTLCTPRLAIDEILLAQQISCYQTLLKSDARLTVTERSAMDCISHTEELGLIEREQNDDGDILWHDPYAAVMMTWYRNNCLHTLAIPSLIACLVVNRRRKVKLTSITTMVATIYPYLAAELQFSLTRSIPEEVRFRVQHLVSEGLLIGDFDSQEEQVQVPELTSHAFYQLDLMAKVILQTLERFFITIALLVQAGSGNLGRRSLEEKCQQVAQRISRLYGLNAPEFFDRQLFHTFVDTLFAEHILSLDENKHLVFKPILDEATRLAQWVIPNEFRYAVLRKRQ